MADDDTIDDARRRMTEAARGIESKYREVASGMRREAGKASEVAREKYEEALGGLREGYGKVRSDLDDWSGDLEDYVRDNPGRSMVIAAAAGFVLGILFRGRRD